VANRVSWEDGFYLFLLLEINLTELRGYRVYLSLHS
jgi:hypothetical protein